MMNDRSKQLAARAEQARESGRRRGSVSSGGAPAEEQVVSEIPGWMTELGRQALRQMKLESIRIETAVMNQEEGNFHPQFETRQATRDEAWGKREDILARNQEKVNGLKTEKKQKEEEQPPAWHRRPLPDHTQELGEIFSVFQRPSRRQQKG
jgi:hypothetical protein